jgi:DNA-binding PadR family transcriptional regulator
LLFFTDFREIRMPQMVKLTGPQKKLLTKIQREGRLSSTTTKGVSTPTLRVLEREGLIRVTWIRRHVKVRTEAGKAVIREVMDWTAEAIMDDYQVTFEMAERRYSVTVYAAAGLSDAVYQASDRLWRDKACLAFPSQVVRVEKLSSALGHIM